MSYIGISSYHLIEIFIITIGAILIGTGID